MCVIDTLCVLRCIVIIPTTSRFCCASLINKIYYNAAADTQMGKIVSSAVEGNPRLVAAVLVEVTAERLYTQQLVKNILNQNNTLRMDEHY